MKRTLLFVALLVSALSAKSQASDSSTFCGYLSSAEDDVFMRIDFNKRNVNVSGQELFGPLPGYISREKSSYCWLILEAEVNGNTATLQVVNDSGSEDLTATLTLLNDSTYELRQMSGSTIKLPKKGKWQKLPRTVRLRTSESK